MTKGDVFVIAGAIVLALVLWAGLYAFPNQQGDLVAIVRVEGKEAARLSISGDTISHVDVTIPRGTATISYGEGKVRVEPLDTHICPNGICWKTGWVARTGQAIVCVPNHMTVTIVGGIDEVDTVVR